MVPDIYTDLRFECYTWMRYAQNAHVTVNDSNYFPSSNVYSTSSEETIQNDFIGFIFEISEICKLILLFMSLDFKAKIASNAYSSILNTKHRSINII